MLVQITKKKCLIISVVCIEDNFYI